MSGPPPDEAVDFTVDLDRIEAAVSEILVAIGEDPTRDGLRDTPARVARMYSEVCSGLHEDPADHLVKKFDVDHDEMVMVRDVPIYSLCEHHLLPFFGVAHVAYIPQKGGMITGLSKLTRLVEGTLVVIEAEHLCMSMRGVRKPGAVTVTSAVHGVFRDEVSTRLEAMRFIEGHRH